MIEFKLEDGTIRLVPEQLIEKFKLEFPGAIKIDEPGKTTDPASSDTDSGSDDGSSGSRETSWWRGEEGFIPDEFQADVSRPDVQLNQEETPVEKEEIFKTIPCNTIKEMSYYLGISPTTISPTSSLYSL